MVEASAVAAGHVGHRDPWRALRAHPLATSTAGAAVVGFSGIFFELSGVAPATGAIFRCVYAIPLLALFARREVVRSATRLEGSWISVAAGTALAVDLIAWHHCIVAAGAGLGTVIGQSQIIFVVAFSALFARERIQQVSRGGIALMVVGIVCISGLLQHSAFGSSPLLGVAYGLLSGATYALFIVLLRMAHRDANRPVAPLLTATSVAAVGALALAALLGELEWPASLAAHGWLAALALSSQVLGWLFISVSIAALPALTTSLILSLQPACALVFAAAILAERPSALQLLGALLVAAGFVAVVGKSPNEKRQQ